MTPWALIARDVLGAGVPPAQAENALESLIVRLRAASRGLAP